MERRTAREHQAFGTAAALKPARGDVSGQDLEDFPRLDVSGAWAQVGRVNAFPLLGVVTAVKECLKLGSGVTF